MNNYKKALLSSAISGLLSTSVWAGEPIEINEDLSFSYKGTLNYSLAKRVKGQADDIKSSGNANFEQGDIINNSLSLLFEAYLQGENYGLVMTGSTFYDDVYQDQKFSEATQRYHGGYSRILDAYVYANYPVGEAGFIDVRVGSHVVSWGEALFFPSMSLAQGPSDAIKASVPGTEVRDILLPEEQISLQYEVNQDLSILAHYQYDFHETLVSTPGSFMSTSEAVGEGAYCLNPHPLAPGGCGFGKRQPDNEPEDGQWGVGIRYRTSISTEIGLYYLNYHSRIPLPAINVVIPGGIYSVNYFDDIDLYGATFTTITGPASIAGEITYKAGAPTLVATTPDGVNIIPTPVRSDILQMNLNAIYNFGSVLGTGNTTLTSEIAYVQVDNAEKGTLDPMNLARGMIPSTDKLYYTDDGLALSASVNFAYPGITSSWDMSIQMAYSNQLQGRTITGGVGGEGDQRLSIGATFTHPVSEVQVSIKYLDYMGDNSLDPIEQKPLADRDNLSLSAKWSF